MLFVTNSLLNKFINEELNRDIISTYPQDDGRNDEISTNWLEEMVRGPHYSP